MNISISKIELKERQKSLKIQTLALSSGQKAWQNSKQIKKNINKQINMFPNSYSFNPGVVLDPITMAPMIGGSFTVNPLGVPAKPQQKVWQKIFLKDIPMECSNDCLLKLLREFGDVKNYKRANNQRGQLLAFCYFDLETGEQILRLKRLFKNIKILDKILDLKISIETQNFIKQWNAMQKDQWRKKLLAPGMNQAKQYNTIQDYYMRDDTKYKQKIQDRLRQVNIQVKKCAIEKMREEQKKQHPREKERERQKKRILEDIARNFQQQEDYLLKRERNKEKQYRKQKQRERSREKAKLKRLQKQIQISVEEEDKRITKFLCMERIKMVEKQQSQDNEAIMEQNPPLPQEEAPPISQQQKKIKAYAGQSFNIQQNNNGTQDEIIFDTRHDKNNNTKKQIKINKHFQNWDKEEESPQQNYQYQLKLPQRDEIQKEKEKEINNKKIQAELESMIPKNKAQLWEYNIDWDRLSKSVVLEKNIRPWLEQQSLLYMGSVQQKFVALVEKKLFSRSRPQKTIKIMCKLIDEDSQQFVEKLWRVLILEDLKLKHGLG